VLAKGEPGTIRRRNEEIAKAALKLSARLMRAEIQDKAGMPAGALQRRRYSVSIKHFQESLPDIKKK